MSKGGERLSVLHMLEPVDGGVARCVLDLAADQARRGWRVAVASPPAPGFADAVAHVGAEHLAWRLPVRTVSERAPAVPARALLRELRPVVRTIDARRPDILHLHSSTAGLAGRLAARGSVATIFQPHAWSFLAVRGIARRAAVRWERLAARWTATVVCVSEAERRLGHQAGVRADFRVIPNAVDLEALREASAQERAEARGRLGLGGEPLVVCVGALRRQKGQDVLLEAWPRVRERAPHAVLAVVGDGPERGALERRAAGGVVFAGDRPDVPDWLAAADVVALPSRWEGMSLVLLEAMARGRSVVATDVPGVREAVGDAGAVVPVEAASPLAAALVERLLEPERAAREGHSARARAERSHDLRRARERFAELYAELATPA
jgi:glycosyltransferase involved in cell wall biosynthesis